MAPGATNYVVTHLFTFQCQQKVEINFELTKVNIHTGVQWVGYTLKPLKYN